MKRVIGIDNLGGDIGIGFALFVVFQTLTFLGIFSLGLPPFGSIGGLLGGFFVYGIFAPVIETALFRGVLQTFLENRLGKGVLPILLQSITFGLFHVTAYSGKALSELTLNSFIAVSGSFISAVIFAIVMTLTVKATKNQVVEYIPHGLLNLTRAAQQGLLSIVGL